MDTTQLLKEIKKRLIAFQECDCDDYHEDDNGPVEHLAYSREEIVCFIDGLLLTQERV